MKVDLHCHSFFSDGTQSPDFLVNRAIERQLTHLAITDHDCLDGLAAITLESAGVEVVPGVEISCFWNGLEIHVVGLLVDVDNMALRRLLLAQQQSRLQRLQSMDAKLTALGTAGLSHYVEELPCVSCTRSHVADFLVQQKLAKSRQKAFKSHLRKRGLIYVDAHWCDLAAGVEAISAAGGIAIIAHPGRYPLNRKKLEMLVDDFIAAGGEALEATYSNIDPVMRRYLRELAFSKSLYLSGGSDFHDVSAQWTDIGKFPPLDSLALTRAVWLHPIWQARYVPDISRSEAALK